MITEKRIGVLHPGEMGVSVAAAARNSGFDVLWASDRRSEATRRRAASHGLRDAETVERLAAECPIIVSVCPPHAADAVAEAVLEAGFRGVYVDANAIRPERSVAMGERMAARGVRFVDGGIVGEPAWREGTTWLHLSGEAAEEVAACFAAGPVQATILGDTVGQASALKMCFAANTKGTTALLAGALATAERLGVREALEVQWDAWKPGYAAEAAHRVRGAASRAWRFAGEMDEISATFRAAGMPGEFHAGAGEVYSRLARYRDVETAPEIEDILAALGTGGVAGPGAFPSREPFLVRPAARGDVADILRLIRGLAEYEELAHAVEATEDAIERTLFGPRPAAEALLGFHGDEAVGIAIFFPTYSTFLARPGLYLEDLFVVPRWRGHGLGRRLLARVAAIAVGRGCGRFEWAVLDWNTPAIDFYKSKGARVLDEWKLCRVTGRALRDLADSAA